MTCRSRTRNVEHGVVELPVARNFLLRLFYPRKHWRRGNDTWLKAKRNEEETSSLVTFGTGGARPEALGASRLGCVAGDKLRDCRSKFSSSHR